MKNESPARASIQDLLERSVPLEWYESVAIVAELCVETLKASPPRIPAASGIILTSDGSLELTERQGDAAGVHALPKLLSRLLALSTAPPRLRLFAMHAVSPGAVTSIEAFAAELSFFERPDRREILKAAFARYRATPAEGPQALPDPAMPDEEPPPLPPRRGRQWPWVAAGAAVAVAAVPTAMYLGMLHRPAALDAAVERSGIPALAAQVGMAAREAGAAVAARLGIGSASGEDGAGSAVVERSPVNVLPRAARSRTVSPVALVDAVSIANPTAAEPLPSPAAGSSIAPPPAELTPDPTVYTSGTEGVEPPRMIDPVLPPPVRAADERMATAMELLIAPDGSVERVTFVDQPTRLTDVMLLSAAKSWRFEPARKDGQPVRYRMTYEWMTPLR